LWVLLLQILPVFQVEHCNRIALLNHAVFHAFMVGSNVPPVGVTVLMNDAAFLGMNEIVKLPVLGLQKTLQNPRTIRTMHLQPINVRNLRDIFDDA
jgi:hypothetical protein